jgi:hypothetical protein
MVELKLAVLIPSEFSIRGLFDPENLEDIPNLKIRDDSCLILHFKMIHLKTQSLCLYW